MHDRSRKFIASFASVRQTIYHCGPGGRSSSSSVHVSENTVQRVTQGIVKYTYLFSTQW